jgi:Domain of Unknown Function (DUF1540)
MPLVKAIAGKNHFDRSSKMMNKQMPPVIQCVAKECAFNRESSCHALAINVGGPEDVRPNCDSFFRTKTQCGMEHVFAGVAVCKVLTCKFNELLECLAPGVNVQVHDGQAECATYKSLSLFRDWNNSPALPKAGI